MLQKAQNFGCGLIADGVEAANTTFVGIYSGNCVEVPDAHSQGLGFQLSIMSLSCRFEVAQFDNQFSLKVQQTDTHSQV